MSYLQIGHTPWSFSSIANLDDATLMAVPEHGRPLLEAANKWLNGSSTFTLYTSGSTGSPKPITFTRDQIRESAEQTINYFALSPGDVLLNTLSVSYVAGFMMLMRSLVLQTPMIQVPPGRNPIPDWLLRSPPQMTALVPLQFKTIAEASGDRLRFLSQINTILLGGGPVHPSHQAAAEQTGTHVYHTYGMTETLTHVAVKQLSPQQRAYFQALPGNTFSKDQQEKLIIHSPLWSQPLYTNDRVTLIDEQHFQWLGRADQVINSGGYKVQVSAVEEAIDQVLSDSDWPFSNFLLTSLPDDTLGEKVVLILEGYQSVPETMVAKLEEQLREVLPRYAVPKAFYSLSSFYHTHTGKLDQRACLQHLNLL